MQEFVDKILASVIRTVVPVIVGLVLSYAVKVGLHLDEAWVTDLVTLAITTAYYSGVRILETRGSAAWGWLLGKASAPKYANGPASPSDLDSAEGVVVPENTATTTGF